MSVDPLVLEDNFTENEEDNNGGVYNSFNLSSYSYSYQNPVIYKDEDGNIPIIPIIIALLVSSPLLSPTTNHESNERGLRQAQDFQNQQISSLVPIGGGSMTTTTAGGGVLRAYAKEKIKQQVKSEAKKTISNEIKEVVNETSKRTGKVSTKLEPNKKAGGHHSTFERGKDGKIYKYETYEKTKSGHFNPRKRYDGGKPDGTHGAPHTNRKTLEQIPTPHVQGKKIPGGVRPAKSYEIPKPRE